MKQVLQVVALGLAVVGLLKDNLRLSSPLSLLSPRPIIASIPTEDTPPDNVVKQGEDDENDHHLDPTKASNVNNALNNQSYIWFGNHWMPPPGVPLYSREDMIRAFSQFDTLWIGDSTTRRAFATTYAIMNATSPSIAVDDLDHPRILDVNKYLRKGYHEKSCHWERTNAQSHLGEQQEKLDIMWGTRSICRKMGNRSYDFVRLDCLKDLAKISEMQWDVKRYSLIIIGMGIHDFLESWCGSRPRNINNLLNSPEPFQKLEICAKVAFQAAQQMASTMKEAHQDATNDTSSTSSPTAVLWRTSGFDSNNTQFAIDGVLHLNQMSIDFVNQHELSQSKKNGTLKLVDWGTAVWPRSFHPHKVEADITAHYGLEARLLMAQMTTQQLMNILQNSST